MRLAATALLAALPAAWAQVSVTVVQEGRPGPRSLCRVEACNLANAPVQVGGGMISQLATLGGFPVVSAGEEERERAESEAGVWRTVRAAATKLVPIVIQGAAVLAVAKKYPIQAQGVLAVAAVAVEMIPSKPRSTLRYLTSAEMLALPAGGCESRYLRARTTGWNAPYHQVIGEAAQREQPLRQSLLTRYPMPSFEIPIARTQ